MTTWIWSHLLKKSLIENIIFCAVVYTNFTETDTIQFVEMTGYWVGIWSDLIIEQVFIKSGGGLTTRCSVTESVRLLWVQSMHHCADVHIGMCNLTGLQHRSSEQHVEIGVTRRKRDNDDLRKIYAWFNKHNPFTSNNSLRSLSSGLTATENDNMNCDDAESVGKNIHGGLDDACVENAKI